MTRKFTNLIEVKKGTWLYTDTIAGWCENGSHLIVYTSSGPIEIDYGDPETVLKVSKQLKNTPQLDAKMNKTYDEFMK